MTNLPWHIDINQAFTGQLSCLLKQYSYYFLQFPIETTLCRCRFKFSFLWVPAVTQQKYCRYGVKLHPDSLDSTAKRLSVSNCYPTDKAPLTLQVSSTTDADRLHALLKRQCRRHMYICCVFPFPLIYFIHLYFLRFHVPHAGRRDHLYFELIIVLFDCEAFLNFLTVCLGVLFSFSRLRIVLYIVNDAMSKIK